MAGVDIRIAQELMGHPTITMITRWAQLSAARLRAAVNKASLGRIASKIYVGTGSKPNQPPSEERKDYSEVADKLGGLSGGAGRVRTAASQFCRLLP